MLNENDVVAALCHDIESSLLKFNQSSQTWEFGYSGDCPTVLLASLFRLAARNAR